MSITPSAGRIPSVVDLIAEVGDIGCRVTQPDGHHTHVYLKLDSQCKVFRYLVIHAMLNYAGLSAFERSLAMPSPSSTILENIAWNEYIDALENKGPKNYQGWIGEMIIDFVFHYFVNQERDLLNYKWYLVDPPKGDVNNHGLDIIAAYVIQDGPLGHICGEIKTYNDLTSGKSDAYSKLLEAKDHQRNAEISQALNLLFRRYSDQIDPSEAALVAAGKERTFLPSVLHNSRTELVREQTFHDIREKFSDTQGDSRIYCRPNQLIGIQVSISVQDRTDEGFKEFFRDFLAQMRLQAREWTAATLEAVSV